MDYSAFDQYCASFKASNMVVQWGGAHVWKVGGKLFAVGGWEKDGMPAITFKTSELDYEILRDKAGCRPAPYLASRGMKWIQRHEPEGLTDTELKAYIEDSYHLVVAKLTKKLRAELGV